MRYIRAGCDVLITGYIRAGVDVLIMGYISAGVDVQMFSCVCCASEYSCPMIRSLHLRVAAYGAGASVLALYCLFPLIQ